MAPIPVTNGPGIHSAVHGMSRIAARWAAAAATITVQNQARVLNSHFMKIAETSTRTDIIVGNKRANLP
jgi:hypothetical protein